MAESVAESVAKMIVANLWLNLWQTLKTGHTLRKSNGNVKLTTNLAILEYGLNENTKIDFITIVFPAVGLYKVLKLLFRESVANM